MKPKASHKPPLTIGKLIKALKTLPPAALLRRATWEALTAGEDNAPPRVAQAFTPGNVSQLNGTTTWTINEAHRMGQRFRIAGYGLISESGGVRTWLLPLTVLSYTGTGVDNVAYRPRVAELDGEIITHMTQMETGLDEVPGLIGYMTPAGDWANDNNPEWRAVKESDPTGDYPPAEIDPAEEVLTTLAALPLQFPEPTVYVSRF